MNKQVVRQVQQNGSRFDICFAPEVREALHVGKGDNVAFEIEPDNEIVKLSRVALADPDLSNPENKPGDNKETSLAVRSNARQVESEESETKVEFCLNCGSEDIEIKGNGYYCQGCDVLYEFTGDGVKPVKLNPIADGIGDLESRLDQVEQDVRDIGDRFKDESDDEDDFLDFGFFCKSRKPVVVMSGADQDENENPGENEIEDDGSSWLS